MTTNVFDVKAAVVASDSRWSYTIKDGEALRAVVYVDDTGFDKMVFGEGACAVFAGRSNLIDHWKDWIRSKNKVVLRRPMTEDNFSMCVVNAATGALIFEHGQKIVDDHYRFAGTGAKHAHTCWINNRDAIKAVRSAAVNDQYSGGEVKYFNIKSQDHNVSAAGMYQAINDAVIERGIVMYPTYEGKTVPIQDAAKTDPSISTLVRNIKTGDAIAEAPSGRDTVVWTDTDLKRLDDSLEAFFGPFAK